MPEQTPIPDELVVTEEGVLAPEELALRQEAGTAAAVVGEEVLLGEEAGRLREESASSPLLTGLERGVSAATFGLTDVLAGEEEREERQRRVEADPTAALVGGIAGAVAPTLLSGGTGALGTLARLTPAGKLAAATGRMASRGGLARVAGAGAVEALVAAGGDYVARTTLDENAEFSGQALVGEMLQGALFGGVAAGAVQGLARGVGRLKRAADDAPLGKLADDVPVPLRADQPARLLSGAKKAKASTNFKSIVRKRVRDDDAAALRSLGDQIDGAVARGARTELDDLVTSTRFLETADDGARALATKAQETAEALSNASRESQRTFKALAEDIDLASAKRQITKDASEPIEDAFVASVAESDQIALRYQRQLDELRARVGIEVPPPVAPDALGKLDNALADTQPGRLARATDVATKAAGVAELARTAGVDVPLPSVSSIPLVGPLMGLYLQAQGVRAAARGLGVLPSTVATRAAGKVVSTEATVADRVRDFVVGTARKIDRSVPTKQALAVVGREMAQVASTEIAQVAADAGTATADTTTAVQQATMSAASRAVEYLQANTPTDPLGYRAPGMTPWAPTTQQAMDWSRRREAVMSPSGAIDTVLNDATSSLELEALESVYPALLEQVRIEMMGSLDELHANRSPAEVRSLALNLDLPIIPETAIPQYGISQMWEPQQQMQPQPQFTRPSTPGASPSVNLEDTRQGR